MAIELHLPVLRVLIEAYENKVPVCLESAEHLVAFLTWFRPLPYWKDLTNRQNPYVTLLISKKVELVAIQSHEEPGAPPVESLTATPNFVASMRARIVSTIGRAYRR